MSSNGYAKDVLVTTDWLADHLGNENLVVAEVDESPELYDESHITGAVKLHWKDDLQDPLERDIIDRESFERLMSSRESAHWHPGLGNTIGWEPGFIFGRTIRNWLGRGRGIPQSDDRS